MALISLPAKMQGWDGEPTLERWWPALKWAAVRGAFRVLPRLSTAALEIDAAGLRCAEIPRLFSPNLVEIDPSLNEDLLDLYGRSEQALANRFTFLNRSEEFEAEIDWEAHESPTWRSELHAFDYALDLALTFRISREECYARHLRYLIAHWIAENPPGQGTGWLLLPLARRVRNWILAADLAREDWERDPVFLRVVRESLALGGTYLLHHARAARFPHHVLDYARALQLAGRFFGGSRGDEFSSAALAILLRELDARLLPDGGYIEPRPSSQLHLAATVMESLIFDAGREEADFLKKKLRQILGFLQDILLPEGTLPLFGPAATLSADTIADVFALAAVILEEPEWKTLAGGFGILPYMLLGEEGKRSFHRLPNRPRKASHCRLPESALYRLSGTDSSAMVINGHLPSSPQDHQDHLSYELTIQGQRVIVDSGAYAPEGESWDESFRSAPAHNVLLVDGRGPQARASNLVVQVRENWENGSGFAGLCLPNRGFTFLGLNHERAWFCLDQRYWVVLDRLTGQSPKRTVSLLHFYPTLQVQVHSDRAIARSRASEVTVIPLGRHPAKMTVTRGYHTEFPGWYAPDFGIKYPASVLALEWTNPVFPWVGGYIIVPGTGAAFQAGDIGAETVCFELSGKLYRLAMRSPRQEGDAEI